MLYIYQGKMWLCVSNKQSLPAECHPYLISTEKYSLVRRCTSFYGPAHSGERLSLQLDSHWACRVQPKHLTWRYIKTMTNASLRFVTSSNIFCPSFNEVCCAAPPYLYCSLMDYNWNGVGLFQFGSVLWATFTIETDKIAYRINLHIDT